MKWRAEKGILVEHETCETIADFFDDHEKCQLAATAPDKCRLVVYIKGGLIQWIFANKLAEVLILDGDIDGCDEDELEEYTFVDGKAKAHGYLDQPNVEPEKVQEFFKEFLQQIGR